jgi:hypothetical protein
MRIRKLALTLTGVTMLLGAMAGIGVAQAPAASASSYCPGDVFLMQSGNGNYAADIAGFWYGDTYDSATAICLAPQANDPGVFRWEDVNSNQTLTGQCLTWNGSTGYIYDASCGRYPASQDWYNSPYGIATDLEYENVYAGKCLAASPNAGTPLYVYSCATGGHDKNQNWAPA